MIIMKKDIIIKCPFCGYRGNPSEFQLIYESVIYEDNEIIEKERRERPPLLICPKCRQGFFLDSPYSRFFRKVGTHKKELV